MKVRESDVQYVAELANLELTTEERPRLLRDLNSILEYVEVLNEVDTASVEPMAQTSDRFGLDTAITGSARFAYAARADVATPAAPAAALPDADTYARVKRSLPHGEALANAPESDGKFFQVPKVIER
jgi:aspartyl-tRNA(Asn)/glutamyl-tRNA(Gln) amidotransferase subunit C